MAKTRCKDPVSSETVRPVATGMKDKWGDSREGTSLSVTSEVHEGNRVPLRFCAAVLAGREVRHGVRVWYGSCKCKDCTTFFYPHGTQIA